MENKLNIMDELSRLDQLCPAGYAIALHISYTTPKFLFQTYDRKWMEVYSKQGLVLKDPTVAWGFGNTGIIRWNDLNELDDSGVLALAKTFGLNFGFTFAIDHGGSKSITSFARNDSEFSDSQIDEISDIIQRLHKYTAKIEEISPIEVEQLRKMSIEFTHS